MTLSVASSNEPGLLLNAKALSTIIAALKFQLGDWQSRTDDEMDEDKFADLQNDIGYLEILLSNLQEEYDQRYPRTRRA